MTVIAFGHHDDPEGPSGRARAALERVPDLPDRRRLVSTIRWWLFQGSRKLLAFGIRAPWLLVCELRPIAVGAGRLVGAWARWCAAAEYAANIAASRTAGEVDKRDADRLEQRKERRRLLSGTAVALACVGGLLAAARAPLYLAAAGALLVLVADAVGRHIRGPAEVALPPPARAVLAEGVPLTQVTRTLVDIALREGLQLGVYRAMRYDAGRREYRVAVTCLDAITPEHLRAFERGLGAADHTIRSLATGDAGARELVIRDGDPLADVPGPDWLERATIAAPLTLGWSVTETPFAVPFAGVHAAVIGRTGSGKTKGMLWTVIDRLLACSDVVVWGVDLAGGPALPMWRGCIQRTAYTVEDAAVLLDAACSEIDRRMDVLRQLAENDDPDDDQDEWASNLGPALVVVVDEFALVAEHNGEKGRASLMGKVEKILRLGRKVWTTLILATQKAGNSDLGSTVAAAQIGVKILMSCTERDVTLMLGTEMRDAGWSPHLLQPATEGATKDAGKAFVYGPAHHSPDIYRSFAPMTPGEVKARARRRIAEGLPELGDAPAAAVDAVEVPTVLAEVERVFADAGWPERMPTADLVDALGVDERQLADMLRPHDLRPAARWRPDGGGNPVRGYLLADVRAALRRFE